MFTSFIEIPIRMKPPGSVQFIVLFVSNNYLVWFVCCYGVCDPCMLACLCFLSFIGHKFERQRVHRRGGSIWLSGRRPGTSWSRQAIYTWYISYPIHLLCMFHKGLLNCMFLYCYSPGSNYLLAQAPWANLLSSFEMTPLNTYSKPLQ
jgi:hypothetical protein